MRMIRGNPTDLGGAVIYPPSHTHACIHILDLHYKYLKTSSSGRDMFWELVERNGFPTFTSKALSMPSRAVRILDSNNNKFMISQVKHYFG
jgi:hypothetical protein